MPEVIVSVGGRDYAVSCQEGEVEFLQAAAGMLDAEAGSLGPQAARLPETRLLLMAGLMLADRTAGMEDQVKESDARLAAREDEIGRLLSQVSELRGQLEAVESALGRLAGLTERAETLARE